MKLPVVLVGFGTTTSAMDTYSFIDERIKEEFPGHEIQWAYSSRMVRDFSRKRNNILLKSPQMVLSQLSDKGYSWALVQSIHLICGHEFDRLVKEIQTVSIRTSVGLPLLSSPQDYDRIALGMGKILPDLKEEAVILIGHGTDHPLWSAYIVLEHWLQKQYGLSVYVGTIEDETSCGRIIQEMKNNGTKKVLLIPFMIVAGVHFKEDLVGGQEDSWKSQLEKEGIQVRAVDNGIGYQPVISDIFVDHIKDAMDVIPLG